MASKPQNIAVIKQFHDKSAGAEQNRQYSLLQRADAAFDNHELEQACEIYRSIIKQEPKNLRALMGYAKVAMQWNMFSLAVDALQTALSVNANHVAVNAMLAAAYTKMQDYDKAIAHYKKVITMRPDDADAHGELARLYTITGDLASARNRYRNAFALKPSDPRNVHGLIQTDEHAITPQVIDTVEQLLSQNDLPLADRCSLYFALGAIFDREARYDEAFANYMVGNIARGEKYDAVDHQHNIDRLIACFDKELFNRHNNVRSAASDEGGELTPVFIVGMPRSGTSLVEQILAGHSEIHAAGELDRIERIAHGLPALTDQAVDYPDCVVQLSSSSLYQTARSHLQYLRHLADGGEKLVTDKMPANYQHLGLIALLFPQAKIIHCERDPLDVCLSCYFRNFAGQHAYASDLQALGHYYKQYQRLMAHWRKVLPMPVLNVSYERMVQDTEAESRRMVDFLGLEWQPQCLQFHRLNRPVNTASLVQVRKPVYHSAVGRWRHYEKYLQALKKNLGVSDIVDEVNHMALTEPTILHANNHNIRVKSCSYNH